MQWNNRDIEKETIGLNYGLQVKGQTFCDNAASVPVLTPAWSHLPNLQHVKLPIFLCESQPWLEGMKPCLYSVGQILVKLR
jgi:hypothetical protein